MSIRSVRVAIVYAGTEANKGRCKDTALLFSDLARGGRAALISSHLGLKASCMAYLAPAMRKMAELDVRRCLEGHEGWKAIVTTKTIHTCVTELPLGSMTNTGKQVCVTSETKRSNVAVARPVTDHLP